MRLVSRADLARLRGVSNAAVTKACRAKLAPACQGDRVNLDHPAAVAYLNSGGISRPRKASKAKPKKPAVKKPPTKRQVKSVSQPKESKGTPGRKRRSSSKATDDGPDDSAPALDENGFAPEIEELVAREIAERYGTVRNYNDWLEAYQKQQRALDLWLKNQQAKGRLIERELVEHHLFGFIDAVFKRLLTDASKTIAARAQNLTRTGASVEEVEREVRAILSTQLQPMKATAARVLRKA